METGDGGLLAFVSHASDDQDMADWVGVVLTEKGIRTWVDSRELHLREDEELVSARIWDALGAATDFVLIASRTALVKPWVIHELQIASERWMGSGAPRIWILVSEGDGEMVEAPFLGVARCDKEGLCSLAARIIEIAAPAAEVAFDNTRLNRLRSQYLMGGSTAVQAVNAFDALLPTLIE